MTSSLLRSSSIAIGSSYPATQSNTQIYKLRSMWKVCKPVGAPAGTLKVIVKLNVSSMYLWLGRLNLLSPLCRPLRYLPSNIATRLLWFLCRLSLDGFPLLRPFRDPCPYIKIAGMGYIVKPEYYESGAG
jgi:hypothetical protein